MLKFHPMAIIGFPGMEMHAAFDGEWQFLMINDQMQWTASYRKTRPIGDVSVSSTIIGPFATRDECEAAINRKADELRELS